MIVILDIRITIKCYRLHTILHIIQKDITYLIIKFIEIYSIL